LQEEGVIASKGVLAGRRGEGGSALKGFLQEEGGVQR